MYTSIFLFMYVSVCFVWLFVVFRPTRKPLIMKTSPFPLKGCTFWPMLDNIAIEQWGQFSVPHLLWHETSVYNGYLRGPVTFTPIAERLAVEVSLPVLTTYVCLGRDSNTNLPLPGRRSNRLRHRSGYLSVSGWYIPLPIFIVVKSRTFYFKLNIKLMQYNHSYRKYRYAQILYYRRQG